VIYPPTAHVMPYLQPRLNTPAMLRALADVAEQFSCINPDFSVRPEWDLLRIYNGGQQSMAVQFSGDFLSKDPEFCIALGNAYHKYGGDPSAFLTGPALSEATHANA
jgi:hypothetical protein